MAEELGQLIGRGRQAEVYAWGEDRVVKLFGKDWRGDAGHEFRMTAAAHDLGLPAPAVERLVEIDGRPGIILERISGPSMMEMLQSRPWRAGRYGRMMAELHARMHSHETTSLPSLKDNLAGAFRQRPGLPDELRPAALDALDRAPDGKAVLHYDLHPVNIQLSPAGPVVLDWETAKRGHPLADVSRTELIMRTGSLAGTRRPWLARLLRGRLLAAYHARYRQLRPYSDEDMAAWRIPNAAARLVFENLTGDERRRALEIVRS